MSTISTMFSPTSTVRVKATALHSASTAESTSSTVPATATTTTHECRNCFNTGHTTSDCRAYCSNCNSREHKAPKCLRACTNCNRTGHGARICRGAEAKTSMPDRSSHGSSRYRPYGARRRDSHNAGNFPTGANAVPLLDNAQQPPLPAQLAKPRPRINVIRVMSQVPTSMPQLPVLDVIVEDTSNPHRVSCQLDTASHINVVTEDFLGRLDPPVERITLPRAVEVAGCDELRTQITQAAILHLRICGSSEPTTFYLMQGATSGCLLLLGSPWLQDHLAQLQYTDWTMQPEIQLHARCKAETVVVPLPSQTAAPLPYGILRVKSS